MMLISWLLSLVSWEKFTRSADGTHSICLPPPNQLRLQESSVTHGCQDHARKYSSMLEKVLFSKYHAALAYFFCKILLEQWSQTYKIKGREQVERIIRGIYVQSEQTKKVHQSNSLGPSLDSVWHDRDLLSSNAVIVHIGMVISVLMTVFPTVRKIDEKRFKHPPHVDYNNQLILDHREKS
jgi:hypothetical protein